MSTMAIPRQLNPAQTAMFSAKMARLPPEHQSDIALSWRERCVAVIQAQADPAVAAASIVAMGVYTASTGWWDGENEARRDELVRKWRTETAPSMGINPATVGQPFHDVYNADGKLVHKAVPDPRTFWRINKTIYPSVALLIASGAAATYGMPALSRMMLFPAIGGLGYNLGSKIRDMAYASRAGKLEAAGVEGQFREDQGYQEGQEAGAASAGGEGNPYAGFPRTA